MYYLQPDLCNISWSFLCPRCLCAPYFQEAACVAIICISIIAHPQLVHTQMILHITDVFFLNNDLFQCVCQGGEQGTYPLDPPQMSAVTQAWIWRNPESGTQCASPSWVTGTQGLKSSQLFPWVSPGRKLEWGARSRIVIQAFCERVQVSRVAYSPYCM